MESELMEFIAIAIRDGDLSAADVAHAIGVSPQALSQFVNKCRGTQVARVEQILDVLGYEIVLRRKK